MTGRTHALLGASAVWLLMPVPGAPGLAGPLCIVAAFGALLPDLDAAESTVKSLRVGRVRPFAPIAALAYRSLGHRSLLHSPVGLLLFACLCAPAGLVWGGLPAAALLLGYASHLAADACTVSGIPAWPNRSDRRFHLLPARFRVVTGSPAEEALLPLLAAAVALLLLSHFPMST